MNSVLTRLACAVAMTTGLWAALPPSALAAPDAALQKVTDCMRANIPPTLRIQEVEIDATDRGGAKRTLKGKLYAMRENKSGDVSLIRALLRIDAPADLSGAAYLIREAEGDHADEMYIYLPAVNRVRRITGASADGSLLGTDFSYNDVKQLQNAFGGADAKLEAPAQIDKHSTYVLAFKPLPGQSSRYSLIRAWVDQKSCLALKADFYEGDGVRKELTAPPEAMQQSGTYWYLSEAEMHDLKDNTRTTLKIVGLSGGKDLPTRYFDPHSFYLGN